jgi:transcriptional regulator with XRE-family HTH domain
MPKSTHTPEYAILLELLKELRDRAGVLQAELAERLETPQSYVSKSENGERRLDILEVRAWCDALGVAFPTFARELDKRLGKRR